MGLLKSICPVCGKEYPNNQMATCGGADPCLSNSVRNKPGCGGRYCIKCYITISVLERGLFKDKYVQHYRCPKCGYDNGHYLEKVTIWRLLDYYYVDKRTYHKDCGYY